jgi:hypothetical protein
LSYPSKPLIGRRVVVVEGDYLIAMETIQVLADAGAEIAGSLAQLRQANVFLASGEMIDTAVLNIYRCEGISSGGIALSIRARGVPILFQTGYTEHRVPKNLSDAAIADRNLGCSFRF